MFEVTAFSPHSPDDAYVEGQRDSAMIISSLFAHGSSGHGPPGG